ncbi:hypothetical protein FN976_01250 [Caenimonas sedimenti]|uniref:Uncharacterized protein n=1 Tax=Caenimonas sedimenti TaxID=2596921 RepID=A0A562ZX52_9BURK|nr:hypothetical protein [Caenimonas sedimenti]TWO72898.1 hypothetical protein FN976_01250 [Caenimonas sedimenti]
MNSSPESIGRIDHFEWEGGTGNRRTRAGAINHPPRQPSQSPAEETCSSGLERRYVSIKAPARNSGSVSPKPGPQRGN